MLQIDTVYVFVVQWDEALLTMTAGEQAEIVIQPEWAYGKKGLEGKYPLRCSLSCYVYYSSSLKTGSYCK